MVHQDFTLENGVSFLLFFSYLLVFSAGNTGLSFVVVEWIMLTMNEEMCFIMWNLHCGGSHNFMSTKSSP